jgi:hypothetical protein
VVCRCRPLVLARVVAACGCSLLAGGCGGGGSPRVASVASSSTEAARPAAAQAGLVGFSRCMRTDGVPSFPDPQRFIGGNVKPTLLRVGAERLGGDFGPSRGEGGGMEWRILAGDTRWSDDARPVSCLASGAPGR